MLIKKNLRKIMFTVLLLLLITQLTLASGGMELLNNGSFETGTLVAWSSDCPTAEIRSASKDSVVSAWGSLFFSGESDGTGLCSIESSQSISQDSMVCAYFRTGGNTLWSMKIGGTTRVTDTGSNAWGGSSNNRGPESVPQPNCFETETSSGVFKIETSDAAGIGNDTGITLDYVSVLTGAKRFPRSLTLTQSPSPANKGDTVRLDMNSLGIGHKMRCGTSEINEDANKSLPDGTFNIVQGFTKGGTHWTIGQSVSGEEFPANNWRTNVTSTMTVDDTFVLHTQYSLNESYSDAGNDTAIGFDILGGTVAAISTDGNHTIILPNAANDTGYPTAETTVFALNIYKCSNSNCAAKTKIADLKTSGSRPGIFFHPEGTYYIDVNVTGLNNTDVNFWFDNLRYVGKKVDAATELCVTDSFVDNPFCEFANNFTSNTTIFCEVFNQFGDKWVEEFTLEANPEPPNAAPVVTVSVEPSQATTIDDLVPTVTIDYEEPAILDNNYTWQFRTEVEATLWQDHSTAALIRIGNTDSYTAATLSSSDTNSGNLWRLKITSSDGNSTTTGFSNIIGIDVDISIVTCVENCTVKRQELEATSGDYIIEIVPILEAEEIKFNLSNVDVITIDLNITIVDIIDKTKHYYVYNRDDDTDTWKFNDSLSFGLDKLWNIDTEKYEFSFVRTLTSSQEEQITMDLKKPLAYRESLQDRPLLFSTDNAFSKTLIHERFVDLFNLSQYTQLTIVPTVDFPIITTTDTNKAQHVISFTASATTDIDINIAGVSQTIKENKKTYYYDVNGDFNILSSIPTTYTKLEIESISIHERGFFSTKIIILDEFNNNLQVILDDNNKARKVLEEGQKFRVLTNLYEKGIEDNQDLNLVIIDVFVFDTDDVNKVVSVEIPILDEDAANETVIGINQLMEGIITTSSTIDDLAQILIRVKACSKREIDDSNHPICYAQQERQDIVLRQFPSSPQQFGSTLLIEEFMVGTKPRGEIFLETDFIESIEYVILSIYDDSKTVTTSDVNKTFFKDLDFSCLADFCIIPFEIHDWIFENESDYFGQITIKVKTSDLDYDNDLLNTIFFLRAFKLDYRSRQLKLFNTTRDPSTYKDFERIPIILQIHDNLNFPTRDDLNIFLMLWDLGTTDFNGGGDAETTFEPLRFKWDYYFYDVNSGINSYAWADRFRESGSALENLHFYRIFARIDDTTNKRVSIIPITLSSTGTGGYNSDFNAFQQTNETSIKIDNSISLDAPLLDQNGINGLLCTGGNTEIARDFLGESNLQRTLDGLLKFNPFRYNIPGIDIIFSSVVSSLFPRNCQLYWVDRSHYVDQIKVFIYNDYSDLTEQNDAYKQYMEFTIPVERLIFNDGLEAIENAITRAPSQCKLSFGADTWGRIICAGTADNDNQLQEIISLGRDVFDFLLTGQDINTLKTINPNTKFLKFNISNVSPLNMRDFENAGINSDNIIPNDKIIKHLKKDLRMRISRGEKAKIIIFQNSKEIDTIFLENRLVDRLSFNEYADKNGLTTTRFNYRIRVDLRYNSGRNSLNPKILDITDTVDITRPQKPFGQCISSFGDFSGCFIGFFSTPEIFVTIIVLIIIGILILLAVGITSGKGGVVIHNITRAIQSRRKGKKAKTMDELGW